MENTNQPNGPTPPPLPGKPKYKTAWYAKIVLGLAMLVNATAQCVGVEFGPETAGAVTASIVIMPGILLVIALTVWRITGRQALPANLVLTSMSFLYLLLSLGLLAQKASGIQP